MRLLAKSAPRCKQLNKVVEIISEEIARRGSITFARFMELALYCPIYGYYEREQDIVGRRGDFYTSVSVGSLFGELLAWQFADWLEDGGPTSAPSSVRTGSQGDASERTTTPNLRTGPHFLRTPQLVEAGAHDGRLAKDILGWLREKRPALFERLEYWIIEPSARRRAWQERTLSPFAGQVHWVDDLEGLRRIQKSGITGVIFSNELLDSFPVHRLGWDAKQRAWFEWGVTVRDGQFCWLRMGQTLPLNAGSESLVKSVSSDVVPSTFHHSSTPPLQPSASPKLPDEFAIEICPAAEQWWRTASDVLRCGKLLTFDYGVTTEELPLPEKTQGTLRAYQGHHVSRDLLASPGQQDLTAHVNFSAIQAAGESAGLNTEAFLTQEHFLTRIFTQACEGESDFGGWSSQRTRQFQTLVHPDHLGRAFRVLVQGRQTEVPA